MKAEVNVRDESGVRLPQLASNNVAYSTDVFHSTDQSADARVQQIIAANDSAATTHPGRKLADDAVSGKRLASNLR
jgi:hypothetical protein